MEQIIPPRAPVRPQAGVVSRRLGDGAVLVHLPTNRIFELNDTGARVWELLAEGKDVPAIVADVTREFAVEGAVAEREVNDLLDRLHHEGLLAS
jgi:Coenzyme PQQ synthesis protein D (PqqD)